MSELASSRLRVNIYHVDVRDMRVKDDTGQWQVFSAKGGLAVNGHGLKAGYTSIE